MEHAAARRHPSECLGPRETLVGRSPAIEAIRRTAARLARCHTPVVITGATGTGKRLVARAIHGADRGLFDRDIAALPETFLEAEVFGIEPGVFRDAKAGQPGMLECADGGTVCFRNFNLWPPHLQPRLLRLLREGVVVRMGSHQPIPVRVRVIVVLTSHDPGVLERDVLSRDLLRALDGERVHVPPLRERAGDIALLARHFVQRFAAMYEDAADITDEALSRLNDYCWPGNVRELANVVERAFALRHWPPARKRRRVRPDTRPIGVADLPPDIAYPSSIVEA